MNACKTQQAQTRVHTCMYDTYTQKHMCIYVCTSKKHVYANLKYTLYTHKQYCIYNKIQYCIQPSCHTLVFPQPTSNHLPRYHHHGPFPSEKRVDPQNLGRDPNGWSSTILRGPEIPTKGESMIDFSSLNEGYYLWHCSEQAWFEPLHQVLMVRCIAINQRAGPFRIWMSCETCSSHLSWLIKQILSSQPGKQT